MATAIEMVADLKSNAEVEVQKYSALSEQIATDLKTAQDEGYDQAKTDLAIPDDAKIYTEADLTAEKQILQDKIDALQAKLDSAAQSQVDAIQAAVTARELEIAADIESVEVDNMALVAKLKAPKVKPAPTPVDTAPSEEAPTPVEEPAQPEVTQ